MCFSVVGEFFDKVIYDVFFLFVFGLMKLGIWGVVICFLSGDMIKFLFVKFVVLFLRYLLMVRILCVLFFLRVIRFCLIVKIFVL